MCISTSYQSMQTGLYKIVTKSIVTTYIIGVSHEAILRMSLIQEEHIDLLNLQAELIKLYVNGLHVLVPYIRGHAGVEQAGSIINGNDAATQVVG